jgi:hypothetical protein
MTTSIAGLALLALTALAARADAFVPPTGDDANASSAMPTPPLEGVPPSDEWLRWADERGKELARLEEEATLAHPDGGGPITDDDPRARPERVTSAWAVGEQEEQPPQEQQAPPDNDGAPLRRRALLSSVLAAAAPQGLDREDRVAERAIGGGLRRALLSSSWRYRNDGDGFGDGYGGRYNGGYYPYGGGTYVDSWGGCAYGAYPGNVACSRYGGGSWASSYAGGGGPTLAVASTGKATAVSGRR